MIGELEAKIHLGSIEEVVEVCHDIPELINPYPTEEYEFRLVNSPLILIASLNNENIGFKVGYDKHHDGFYYSWLGAVKPEYRNFGIAQQLLDYQEKWARKAGYNGIRVKTRNRFDHMIRLLTKNGYYVYDLQKNYKDPKDFRILYIKVFE